GGFYTYSEVLAQLDEMKTLFPNLITDKFSIGTSIEGRTIWAVKISDNPDTDESASEAAVYYDALTHAREPASMATTINFMFHLLENYGSDSEATYLINNREIFVVPVVNPDGYVYNESTNPNGGGMWRKNRRNNSGSCEGVDINRNFDWMWSSNSGSSGNTCSESYRGTSAFSEPETQAIRDFATSINPPIAYTTHTFQGSYLMIDFSNGTQDYALPAEFSNDCLDDNEYIYGDADVLLGFASGTTQYWMFDALGTIIWTPELGETGFWPAPSEIIPLVEEHLKPFIYISWVAGAYADFQGFNILNNSQLRNGENLSFNVEVKNKGLSQAAQNVTVDVSSPYANIVPITTSASYGNIASRTTTNNNASPFEFSVNSSANVGDQVKFYVDVKQEGTLTRRDSFYVTVGEQNILFSEDAEGSLSNWSLAGTGAAWATTNEDAYGGTNAIADSPIGNINNSGSTAIQMSSAVNLSGANAPRLEYAAKWGHENGLDRTRVQISTDGGSNWATLTTPFTTSVQGSQGYTGNETWIYESIDLSTYIGQSIQIRFATFANGSTPSDGFYFDNFRIVDYSAGGATPTCSDGIQNGDETGVDCGGSCPTACPTCSDGIQNGDETGVDCGGSCPTACPTCSDGIQNGDETGVDCGGSCSPCTGCNTITIISDDFEAGFGNWNDGGSDCFRSSDPTYANSGTYSVRLRDNTSTSVATTDLLELSMLTGT
ncbi:MAG: M14 family zinc carboxypeptidase, partial [Bacteroidota bacterium]